MKPFEIKSWNYVLVEGYCSINWKYRLKYSKWVYSWNPKTNKKKKVRNTSYDPTVKMSYPPDYCLGHVSMNCIKCKHFTYCDVEFWIRKKFNKVIK